MRFAAISLAANALRESASLRMAIVALLMGFSLCFSGFSAQAQDLPKATVCEQGVISLPENQNLAPVYVIDLSGLTFSSTQEMVAFCSTFNTEEFILRANPDKNEAVLMLQTKGRTDWSVQEWNGLFQTKCEAKPLVK
jgi:hypothetical protein